MFKHAMNTTAQLEGTSNAAARHQINNSDNTGAARQESNPPATSVFRDAQNTNFQGSVDIVGRDQFNIGRVERLITNDHDIGAALQELFRTHVVPDAAYNRHGHRDRCLSGTRQLVIANIMDWVRRDGPRQISWLYGPAGYGKSALAQTIADKCAELSLLAASFFFRRGVGDRARFTRFIPTLSYQLTNSIPDTQTSIQTVLQKDLTILHQSLENQLQKLLINPILALNEPIPRRMIVIVDALDECEDKDDIAEFIEILLRASRERRLPLLFLLTGRSEAHIAKKLAFAETQPMIYSLALENFDARVDIHTFLRFRFSEILKENHRLIQQQWPADSDIEALVAKSSGSFIFASTVIDFIMKGVPQRRLETVLKAHNGLDALYMQVFSDACRDDPFDLVIGTFMLIREQLSVTNLGDLLQRQTEDILHAMLSIQSILRLPEDNDKPVELIHTSLRDFLVDKSRSGDYFIKPATQHAEITTICLNIMMRDAEKEMVAKSGVALYACRYWCHHLDAALEGDRSHSGNSSFIVELIKRLQDFKTRSLKYWINTVIRVSGGDQIVEPLSKMISQTKQSGNPPKNLRKTLRGIDKSLQRDIEDFAEYVLRRRYHEFHFFEPEEVFKKYVRRRLFKEEEEPELIDEWRHDQNSQSFVSMAVKHMFHI